MISLGEISEIRSNTSNSQIQSGSIVLSTKGSIGEANIVNDENIDNFSSSRWTSIRITKPTILPEYLLKCLRSEEIQDNLKKMVVGTTIQNVRLIDIGKLQIPDETVEEQKKLVQTNL